jgi:nucleoside-diphosphate-sugar epimerase
VHAAGRAHVESSTPRDLALLTRDNVEAARRLARAARRARIRRFVHLSSIKVNADASAPERPLRGDDPPAPVDAYARSKLEAEGIVAQALAGSGTALTILRLPLVYGPGAAGNYGKLVKAVAGRRVLPFAAIDNRRRLLSIRNLTGAVRAILDAANDVTGVYLLGDADTVSTPDLVRAIASALGVPPRMTHVRLPVLRLAGRFARRSAAIDRLTQSLDFDVGPLTQATGWRPASFGLAPEDVGQTRGR